MACEVGLYYVLHITKQRNKNALLRLLPGLGECAGGRTQPALPRRPLPSPQPVFPKSRCHLSLTGKGPGASQLLRPGRASSPPR